MRLKVVEDPVAVGHHRRRAAGHGRVAAGARRQVKVAATTTLDKRRIVIKIPDGLILGKGRPCQLAKNGEPEKVSVAAEAFLGFVHQLIVLRL